MTITALPLLLPAAFDAGEQRLVRCRVCRRPLRSADSRALGIGDDCRLEEYAGRRFDTEQEALRGL